ncbi:MAG: pyridoxal-phosphate dependent enzyme [Deltaproteobacteria bacterium]|nr:pyridoxal-phosphate dependent enzyme [Deltaproteobacteria bacterium]
MRNIEIDPVLAADARPIAPEKLELARSLGSRLPEAGLRRVALIRADSLNRHADPTGSTRLILALENLQITGSFKIRGALSALDAARRAGATGVVAASAGNHGIGVARAARLFGMSATIVVPETAAKAKIAKIRAEGAELAFTAQGYDAAEALGRELASRRGLPWISPYDDVDVLAGNGSSLAFEIVDALGKVPEHVLVPIGGGGLATGMAWGLAASAGEDPRKTRRVWTAQSEASAAFALSLERGSAVEQLATSEKTLADGLEGGISATSFARASSVVAGVSVLAEARIAFAMALIHYRLGLRLEGSAAAALVPAIDGLPPLIRGGDLVIVLTGRNVDRAVFDGLAFEPSSFARLSPECGILVHRSA